ncbi:MAG: hypothetical protein MI922_06320 [Bacteroidales bacterium]|nr:hypothetical protein [Bacteroidales bacterium]
MDPEEIVNFMKDPDNQKNKISGIYNYCDRWCERCAFTSRCMNYAMGEAMGARSDESNEAFWNDLENIFEATFMMIEEEMEKMGVDMDEVMKEVEEDKKSYHRDWDDKHPLFQDAYQTGRLVHNWLQEKADLLQEKAEESLAINEERLLKLKDSLEVIQWYNMFVAPKIDRALSKELWGDDDIDESMEYDKKGSAKVALVAIERSIGAWGFMLEVWPNEQDFILDVLRRWSVIRDKLIEEVPSAPAFKRPGFEGGVMFEIEED